jgi:hypothetical protein
MVALSNEMSAAETGYLDCKKRVCIFDEEMR